MGDDGRQVLYHSKPADYDPKTACLSRNLAVILQALTKSDFCAILISINWVTAFIKVPKIDPAKSLRAPRGKGRKT